ncbi:DNA primase [Chitinasiproducens palmae]|uniref:DNA primase n=1 Tax=Chitinasiproducens palmae TaxID=1770053 RepID=A0A1H2PSS9_9BURK|nr:DNA primase [Chitinasiproducens palmae]SDV50104.1 DNA primase [Chitinasiproducens palmae]
MIPNAFLQDLLNRVDIVEVVGRHVKLKKAGANYSGLCPFHNEKSPSFTVSATKQFYHCFGCGAHGSAISFLMEHLGLSFPEAVADLAHSQGLTVPQESNRPGGRGAPPRAGASHGGDGPASPDGDGSHVEAAVPAASARQAAPLVEVMQLACDYYRRALRGAPVAIEYLKGRGLSGEIAARFGLGYAPDGWQNLASAGVDYDSAALVDAGLVLVSEKKSGPDGEGRRYDRFRDRIMFPIRNSRGKVIAFGGRVLGSGEPKYLNSPETPLFSKGSELYGLFEARQAIREQGFVLVVEGYMDVVALAQLGFPNAVATLGTACTPVHVQKLVRQTDRIVFSFDGDKAGRRAARRALEAALPHAADQREIAFLFLPAEHDPDSFVREFGREAFAGEIARATPLSDFLLSEAVAGKALDRPEGRAKALFDAKPLLRALPKNALRVQILHALADRLGLSVGEVAELCEVELHAASAAPRRVAAAPFAERRRVVGTEQRALRNLLMFPRVAAALDADATDTLALCARHHALFAEVIEQARALGDDAEFRHLADALRRSAYAETFVDAFDEILSYDENARDLLLYDPSDAAQAARHRELEQSAEAEVHGALARMRYDACCERLSRLSRQGALSADETAEFAALSRLAIELKRGLAPVSSTEA